MRLFSITGVLCAFGLAQAQVVTIPAGTKIPLVLTSPVETRTARLGDTVRARTSFPVTVESRVAIPSGTYVEGAINRVKRRGRHAGIEMRFARLLFSNGYTVTLTGSASAGFAMLEGGRVAGIVNGFQSIGFPQQPFPTLTQPKMPSHKGLIIGLTASSAAAAVIWGVLASRSGGGLYLEAGSPVDMILATPLTLDSARLPMDSAEAGDH